MSLAHFILAHLVLDHSVVGLQFSSFSYHSNDCLCHGVHVIVDSAILGMVLDVFSMYKHDASQFLRGVSLQCYNYLFIQSIWSSSSLYIQSKDLHDMRLEY